MDPTIKKIERNDRKKKQEFDSVIKEQKSRRICEVGSKTSMCRK